MAPRGCLPIVFLSFCLGNPRRQGLEQITCERENVRLVHAAKFGKAAIGGFTVVKFEAVLREGVADAKKIGGGKTVLKKRARRSAENLREIDDCVASDGKGEFGLAFARAFDADEDQGTGIENCSEG